MTTTVAPAPPNAPPAAVWRMAVASFLPPERRARAVNGWIKWLPLALILVAQGLMSLRLHNSPQPDEALYLYTGHWYRSGHAVYSNPTSFFSGAPQLYPILGSYFDSLGGLRAARAFSAVCMMSSTFAVYWTTSVLFAHRNGRRAGLFAALAFSLSAPVIFLGNYATFDAPSFTMIAWAMALAVWSSKENKSIAWSLLIGGLCALAVLFKYSSAIDVPFVMALTLIGWKRYNRTKTLARGVTAGLTCLILLAGSVMTWAAKDLVGLKSTTTARAIGTKATVSYLSSEVFTWTGLSLTLMLLGGVYLMRRQPLVGGLLLLGTVTAAGYQIHMGESTSLNKHITLGLIFGAPLAGLFLSDMSKRFGMKSALITGTVMWVTLLLGLQQSASLFAAWPNTTGLDQTLAYSIKAMPWIHMVGDIPEPSEYAFPHTQPWQWTATWNNSFYYKGLSNLAAYEAALKDNYFQLAFFDAGHENATAAFCGGQCTGYSATLTPLMPSFGFKKTGTVTAPDGHKWTIWQRYDHIPK